MLPYPPPIQADDAVFLDVDGTLMPIIDDPAAVVAPEELRAVIATLSDRVGGALALVSGRNLESLDRVFAPLRLPAAGSHGAELRLSRDSEPLVPAANTLPRSALDKLRGFAQSHKGLLLESKPSGVALHYRLNPDMETACREQVVSVVQTLEPDYRLIAGKMVFEIAPALHDKGVAIRQFLERQPFAGRRPVFVGDDVTDEDGFNAVRTHDGVAVLVGDKAATGAEFALQDVQAVRDWLQRACLDQ
ncbi:MAG: trehalose-phosphatase [Pseudomonadota bacterium]